jgi:hypothetical protein
MRQINYIRKPCSYKVFALIITSSSQSNEKAKLYKIGCNSKNKTYDKAANKPYLEMNEL